MCRDHACYRRLGNIISILGFCAKPTKINYFNADHTHALIDLPTRYSIEEVIKVLKGGSSYWINHSQIIKGRFAWGVGYGAFSVSHSDVGRVARYIASQ